MSSKRGKKTMLPHSNIAIARKNNDIAILTWCKQQKKIVKDDGIFDHMTHLQKKHTD
jgi:hypothetical protein